jgi:hypothetical protein
VARTPVVHPNPNQSSMVGPKKKCSGKLLEWGNPRSLTDTILHIPICSMYGMLVNIPYMEHMGYIKLCVFAFLNSHVTCLLLEHDRHVRRRSHGNHPTQWTFGVPTILHNQRN